MQLKLTDEQKSFWDTTRRFIEAEVPLDAVRDLYAVADGFDRAWWRTAAQIGWTSLFVPEALGGGNLSGFPTADAAIVAEEMGRLVSPGPFLPVNVVAAGLAWSGDDTPAADVLSGLAAGETIASWAFAEPGDRWNPDGFETTAVVDDRTVTVAGEKAYVEAAAVADHLLVTARGKGGLTQVLVPADAPGVTVLRGRSIDLTRRYGRVRLDAVRLPVDSVVGEAGRAALPVQRQLGLAVALQCAEMVGLAQRSMDMTVSYGRDRIAFGRPIVSFQALKHRIADMAVHLEGMKAVTEELVVSVDANRVDMCRLASVAKAYVAERCQDIVDDCTQISGGMGVTWEHDLHLYNRRAAVDRAMWGTPEQHRRQLLALISDGGQP